MRLDHLIASPALAARAVSCAIDRGPRKWMKPSDHAPVTAVFDI
jgi:exodeoxyribonuclease-3